MKLGEPIYLHIVELYVIVRWLQKALFISLQYTVLVRGIGIKLSGKVPSVKLEQLV